MADYPERLTRTHTLFDGRRVTIRAVRPDDAARMQDFLKTLSGENRYLRFLKWIGAPGDALVQFMTDVDYHRHMALVCTVPKADGEEIIGEARYVVDPQGSGCEFGIVIADAWHKSGIAGVLMATLIEVARACGVKTMEGSVLRSNTTMLKFVRALGFAAHAVAEDRTLTRVVKSLA